MDKLAVLLEREFEGAAACLDDARVSDASVQARFQAFDDQLVKLLLKREQGDRRLALVLESFAGYRSRLQERALGALGRARLAALPRSGQLVLMLTRRCQLRCTYCGIGEYGGAMTEETLRRAVDFLFASSRRDLRVQFFGGEPALEFRLIRKAVGWIEDRARSSGKTANMLITTNGLLLNARMLEFFREHDILVDLSWDGERATQLAHRRSASGRDYFPQLLKNTDALLASGVRRQITMVVPPESVEKLFSNVKFLVGRGHRRIQINYAGACFWPRAKSAELLRQVGLVCAAAPGWPGFELLNATELRWEPALVNSSIVVDYDGTIFRDMGFYQKKDPAVAVGPIGETEGIDELGLTPFETFWRLSRIYSLEKPSYMMKLLINNIVVGQLFELACRGFTRRAGRHKRVAENLSK